MEPPEHHRFRSDADERRRGKSSRCRLGAVRFVAVQQNNLKVPVDRGRVPGGVRFTDEALRRGWYGIAEVLDGVVLVQKGLPSKPEVLSGWSKLRQEIEPLMK